MTFASSGSDDDLREAYRQRQVAERREKAQSLFESAQNKVAGARNNTDLENAEGEARAALSFFARSLDWAEDTDDESEAHRVMDEAGAWVRRTFFCHLERSGTKYEQTCPVALAHNRLGFSIGGVAIRVCSLCGGDLSECEHLPGTAYLVPGGTADLGWCRVCLNESCDDHLNAYEYRAPVVGIVREMDVEEVSLVSKPAHPEARLGSVSISAAALQGELGDAFVAGMQVSCDRCLLPCDGLIRHEMPHG